MARGATEDDLERADAGQSLTEMATVVVLFVVVALGILDGGRLIFAYNTVSASAREGVRWAAVRGATSPQVATADDIRAFVLTKTLGLDPIDVNVSWDPANNNQPGSAVVVQVTNVFTSIAPFPFVPNNINLRSTSRMIIAR